MSYFPVCVDLAGKDVYLIGNGGQIRDKASKLRPFGANLIQKESFTREDARRAPALVVVGDLPLAEAEVIHALCREYRIPVNVVDVPRLCSFSFPALITRGELTVSVSTGGASPAAAAYLRGRIEEMLPEQTEQILDWLCAHRKELKEQGRLKQAVAEAFTRGRIPAEPELSDK